MEAVSPLLKLSNMEPVDPGFSGSSFGHEQTPGKHKYFRAVPSFCPLPLYLAIEVTLSRLSQLDTTRSLTDRFHSLYTTYI
jgi:hypothetical protein